MNYPRIYSLSTVGILRHYIHDYLIHWLRTDFIGGNGVGKSIIADLLQILFIFDKEFIQFGTDGVRVRSLDHLAYKTNIAYCFINVEVEKGRFLLLGTAILVQKGVRLMPFLITSHSDLEGKLESLTMTPSSLLHAADFLKDNRIPDLEHLSRSLLERRLYLTRFRTREEIKKYYQFLYEKEILSINLSIDSNFEAFSKVIQSFSKAKALNLSPSAASKSLKDFLFEDSDQEIIRNYEGQQNTLRQIMRDYERLDKDIRLLTRKQDLLKDIKHWELVRGDALKDLKAGLLSNAFYSLEAARQNEQRVFDELARKTGYAGKLMEKLYKGSRINARIDSDYQKANQLWLVCQPYDGLVNKIEHTQLELTKLKLLVIPPLTSKWKEDIIVEDLSTRNAEAMKELIRFAEPYIRRYSSFEELIEARDRERKEMNLLQAGLLEEEGKLKRLISMFEVGKLAGLLGWIIKNNPSLSTEQRTALLHFSDLPIDPPQLPVNKNKYLDPNQLIEEWEESANKETSGFWLRLGALREFIAFDPDARLLENTAAGDGGIKGFLDKLHADLKLTQKKIGEINQLMDGKAYDETLIGRHFDFSIVLSPSLEKLKVALMCIVGLGDKILQLQSDETQLHEQIGVIKKQVPANIWSNDPSALMKSLSSLQALQRRRSEKYNKAENQLNSEYDQTQQRITELKKTQLEAARDILDKQTDFSQYNTEYFELFHVVLVAYVDEDQIDLNDLQAGWTTANMEFIKKYENSIDHFEETSQRKNIAVNMEIDQKTYSFRVLEEALLGSRIKATDDIAGALHSANQERLSMADEMKASIVRVFDTTLQRYRKFKETVQNMNKFFLGKKISNEFFFKIEFSENKVFKIQFVEEIGEKIRNSARSGELAFDKPVDEFIQEFFKRMAQLNETARVDKLLSPNTYFDLSVSLTDDQGNEMSGSTGETYSAIALLGIARLSIAQTEKRKGLRFIILEELGSLDNTNFNTFPAIAKEFCYQIITMAPRPYMTGLSDEWYAHHLIKGKNDEKINYYPSASYFHSKEFSEDLQTYKAKLDHELAGTKGAE
jgi:exonuclease SbcC